MTASLKKLPKAALQVSEAFEERGHRVWLVGGWVRDALLGRIAPDLDFATDASPAQSLEALKTFTKTDPWTAGIAFGTVGARRDGAIVEVTTFRAEVYRSGSRHPTVRFAKDLQTDLQRRDFTVNAMAISVPEGQLIDPLGGLGDLKRGVLRTPLEPDVSFGDDPLRMLRAFRFMSQLGFSLDTSTFQAIGKMNDQIEIISADRIRDELSKLILGAEAPKALAAAVDAGLLQRFLPELPDLRLEQDPVQRHKDVYQHTLAVLSNVCEMDKEEPDLALRLAALLHDCGKPRTRQITKDKVMFHQHEVVGASMASKRLRALNFPSRVVHDTKDLIFLHHRFHTFKMGWTDSAVRRYVRDAGALLGKLNTLVRADCTTRNPARAKSLAERMDELEARIRELAREEELDKMRPALDGNRVMELLGLEPGRAVGDALDFLMEIRLSEGVIDEKDAEERLKQWLAEQK